MTSKHQKNEILDTFLIKTVHATSFSIILYLAMVWNLTVKPNNSFPTTEYMCMSRAHCDRLYVNKWT